VAGLLYPAPLIEKSSAESRQNSAASAGNLCLANWWRREMGLCSSAKKVMGERFFDLEPREETQQTTSPNEKVHLPGGDVAAGRGSTLLSAPEIYANIRRRCEKQNIR